MKSRHSNDEISDDVQYFDDPVEVRNLSFHRNKIVALALVVFAGTLYLNGTFAANISLSSGRSIEFGQGSNIAVSCTGATGLTVTPRSSFANASNGTGTHYLNSIQVSNIPTTCNGVDFKLSVYDDSVKAPLSIFNTSSTQATVWDSDDGFVIGASTLGATVQSANDGFTLTFDTPTATSSSSVKITLQTQTHASCFSNSSIQCGFAVTQTSFSAGTGIANSYDGNYVYVLNSDGSIFRSVNGGKTFSISFSDTALTNIMNVSTSKNGQYVVGANSNSGGGVYFSSDYGVTWSEKFPSSSSTDKSFQVARISEDGQHIIATLLGAQSGKIFYSHDTGATWSYPSVRGWTGTGSRRNDGTINEDGTVMAVMMQNGYFFRSIDSGVTWDTQTAQTGNWTVFMSGDGNFMGTVDLNSSIWSTSDGKAATPTWVNKVGSGNPSNVFVCRSDPNRLAYTGGNGSQNAPLFISLDKGKNWTRQTSLGTGWWQGISFNGDCSRLYLLAYDNKLYVSNG
jgi:hypothetical protein